MAKKPQRTIEAAKINNLGLITAIDLLSMPENRWGVIRDRITDHRTGKGGLSACCMECGSDVYIRTARQKGVNRPLFNHYRNSDPNCRWYQGRNMRPDDARALQYQGKQESEYHRAMCEQIAELAALDKRYITSKIDKYLPPTENDYGRYPDVFINWAGFGEFAIEFQMSNTFQTEISQRCKHYERENIPLLWILFGIDTSVEIQQSFKDVIRRHRGNAFVLDSNATLASKEQNTLILTCYLQNNVGFDDPVLVRFDELIVPNSKLPYFEDRITKPLLDEISQRRRKWFDKLKDWDHHTPLFGFDRRCSLLVAAAFSIVATANGKKQNFASAHTNIKGMLNTHLNSESLSSYANLLKTLLAKTTQKHLLDGTVGEHLRRQATKSQKLENSEEWKLLRNLIPEVLDPVVREELIYFEALPNWAT